MPTIGNSIRGVDMGRAVPNTVCWLLVVGLAIAAPTACSRDGALTRLLDLENNRYGSDTASPERIAELQRDIDQFSAIVEQQVTAAGRLGTYYRMLGLAHLDLGMYALAAAAFENAIGFENDNPKLFYHAAVATAHAAKAQFGADDEREGLLAAARLYGRAVELDPNFRDALFGLAVLLLFELDDAATALPITEQLLVLRPTNSDYQFLSARALVMLGRSGEAVEIYATIARTATDPAKREEANRNRILLMENQ